MIYEFSALLFAIMTGYVAVRYEGTITSRIAVVMLLTAAGGSLAAAGGLLSGDEISLEPEFSSLLSIIFLILGHITSEIISRKLISSKKKSDNDVVTINNAEDLLSIISSSKDLKLETELNIKFK
ncbi:hypothetical protein [Alteromonas stellipolaris]|uniref:Uncharacterized protein n=1 Tax=Alteromonas stellipolaris TaxID=233316 RepID=A0AAW7YXF4_9ALTE|nr:hypothetical protein [Alteromonas stellipolaris]MDO6575939.1 hypothetical protein [Alteromonas stellipolaris]